MKTYTTVQGDTWDIVSYRVYGDEGFLGNLIAANPAHVNTVIFPVGVVLTVPEVTSSSTATNLPPWRKGG